MDEQWFRTLLETLSPETLAAMVADLQEAQEDWQHYPEEVPAPAKQAALIRASEVICELGQAQAPDFQQLVAQVQAQKVENTWAGERDRQEIENWLSDFD